MRFATTVLTLLVASIAAASAQFDRIVLIEEFTSVTCDPCVAATQVMNDVLNDNGERAISIRYHVNFPLPGDPWYAANQSAVDSRVNVYNVEGVPHARVDGVSRKVTDKSEMVTSVSNQRQVMSPIQIDVAQSSSEVDRVSVDVDVTAGGSGLGGGYRLYVAVVEDFIEEEDDVKDLPGYNGETEFFDVFRAFANGAAGEVITLNPSQTKSFSYTYDVEEDWVKEELYVVAFVQDQFSFDIVQAGFTQKLGSNVPGRASEVVLGAIDVLHAPAADFVTIDCSDLSRSHAEVSVEIFDATGRRVRSMDIRAEDGGSRLDVSSLPAGAYFVTARSGELAGTGSFVRIR